MLVDDKATISPRAGSRQRPAVVPDRSARPRGTVDIIFLAGLSAIVGSVVFFYGGTSRPQFEGSLTALGLFSIAFWLLRPARLPTPGLAWRWTLPLAGFPLLVVLQIVPLPIVLLEVLSPARAALEAGTEPLSGVVRFVPLSVDPGATVAHLVRILAYRTVYLVVRELGWRLDSKCWMLALPPVGIAAAEAAMAMAQWTNGAGQIPATGSYVNPNHLAGLLALVAPMAAAIVLVASASGENARARRRRDLAVAGAIGAAATVALGVTLSLSRMGLLSAFFGVCASLAAIWNQRRSGISWTPGLPATAALLALAILVILIYMPPDKLIGRFGYLTSGEGIAAHSRMPLWRDTVRLIREYPLLGCGLGAFAAPFLKHKTSEPMLLDQYAHNDYLQALAETGLIGFALLLGALFTVLYSCWSWRPRSPIDAALSAGAFGSFTVIALHSLTDFNLYIPANTMILAWIGGIAASVQNAPSQGAEFHATTACSRLTKFLPLRRASRR